jgi:16S rRNA (cytosine967-C5)-methyltransferase
MATMQAAILASAARMLKPGGRLVYATCSLLTQENEEIAQAFSAEHKEFTPLQVGDLLEQLKVSASPEAAALLCSGPETRREYLRLWPHRDKTDGFFAAVWQRQA